MCVHVLENKSAHYNVLKVEIAFNKSLSSNKANYKINICALKLVLYYYSVYGQMGIYIYTSPLLPKEKYTVFNIYDVHISQTFLQPSDEDSVKKWW